MRRFINFIFLLIFVGSVGLLLVRAKIINFPSSSLSRNDQVNNPVTTVRKSLRVCVVGRRPEALLVSALKLLLDTENQKIEIRPYNPETSWMELAVGEVDVIVAPIEEAIIGQARFQAGHFLFTCGLSEGYDVIFSKEAQTKPLKTLGIVNGQGSEHFAIGKFPDAKLIPASSDRELQNWLVQGAIQAAVLQDASLSSELAKSLVRLGATDSAHPMPTVVVLSRTLSKETPENSARISVLIAALNSWKELIGYLERQPDRLRSTLKSEADPLGIDIDLVLKSYTFLTPAKGREVLMDSFNKGSITETFGLLALAKVSNLLAPNWQQTLERPSYLSEVFSPPPPEQGENPLAPTPEETIVPDTSNSGHNSNYVEVLGNNQYPGPAPKTVWPVPTSIKVANSLNYPPTATQNLVGIATINGLEAYSSNGELAFQYPISALMARPVASPDAFYLLSQNEAAAVDMSGAELWKVQIPGQAMGEPVLTPTLFVFSIETDKGQQLIALNKDSGTIAWLNNLKEKSSYPPVYSAGSAPKILLADDSGQLTSWQADDKGTALGQTSLSEPQILSIATQGNLLAISYPDGKVELRSANTSSIIWQTDLKVQLSGSPTIPAGGSIVLVPSKTGVLYGLDSTKGQVIYKENLSAAALSAPIVVEQLVYITDQSGNLYCLTINNDKLSKEWSKPLELGAESGLAFAPDFWALGPLKDQSTLVYMR